MIYLWRKLLALFVRFWRGSEAFRDLRAWAVIALCAGGVSLFDPVMAKLILQWVLIFGVFAGLAVLLSRHVLPQIQLGDHVAAAYKGNTASGLVVLAVALFLSFLVLAIALWAKA